MMHQLARRRYTSGMSDDPGLDEEERRVWRAYRSAHSQLVRELDRRLQADSGISQADFAVLSALAEAPDRRLRIGRMAELLAWEKSRVSHQVSRMESRGLLTRTECDLDARGTWIEPTPQGRRTLLGAIRTHSVAVRELFLGLLSEVERTAVRESSERVLEHLEPCEAVDADAEASAERASA